MSELPLFLLLIRHKKRLRLAAFGEYELGCKIHILYIKLARVGLPPIPENKKTMPVLISRLTFLLKLYLRIMTFVLPVIYEGSRYLPIPRW